MHRNEYLELADWRRRVAVLYARWRDDSAHDPEAATVVFRSARDQLFRDHPQSPLAIKERSAFAGLPWWPYDRTLRMTVRLEPDDGAAGPHEEAGLGAPAVTGEPRSTGVAALEAVPVNTFGSPAGAFAGGTLGGVAEVPPIGFGAPAPIALPNSGSGSISFRRIGTVALDGPLAGRSLSAYWIDAYGGGIFLPFRDATSGTETYGAGRYLLDTIKAADMGGDAESGTLLLDFNMAYHPSCAYDPRWSCPLAPRENWLSVPVAAGERLRAGSAH